MLTNEHIADILDDVADHLEADGWEPFFPAVHAPPYLVDDPGPGAMSVLGAVHYLITGSPARWDSAHGDPRLDDVDQVMRYLDARVIRLYPGELVAESCEPFMSWHTETQFPDGVFARSESDVLTFLRATVAELRTPGTGDTTGHGAGDSAGCTNATDGGAR